jgi:hypothetical protein
MPQQPHTADLNLFSQDPQFIPADLQFLSDPKIAEYVSMINEKADNNSPELLPNSGEIHASIAMSKLLEKTKEIARIIVGSFSGPVCDRPNYLASLRGCISRDVKFRIIHIDDINTKSEAYQYLIAAKGNGKDILFHRASDEFKNKITINNVIRHFAVFDEDKFRYEVDTKKFVGWFSFNDSKNASILLRAFDKEI